VNARAALVRIRLSGDPAAVQRAAALIRERLQVEAESPDYPNRHEAGVRRYLSARLERQAQSCSGDPLAEVVESEWLAEPPPEGWW
jgi:hypothetical protein